MAPIKRKINKHFGWLVRLKVSAFWQRNILQNLWEECRSGNMILRTHLLVLSTTYYSAMFVIMNNYSLILKVIKYEILSYSSLFDSLVRKINAKEGIRYIWNRNLAESKYFLFRFIQKNHKLAGISLKQISAMYIASSYNRSQVSHLSTILVSFYHLYHRLFNTCNCTFNNLIKRANDYTSFSEYKR